MAVQRVKGRKPKHQRQIGTSPTGAFDCGPRSWQMGIDVQTGGLKRPGPTKLRKLARRIGSQTTRAEDADKAVEAFGGRLRGFKEPLRYRMKLRRPWEEAEKALRNRRAVHIAIDYGVVNRNKPEFSSQSDFDGGHSILLFGIRKARGAGARGWEIGVNDPLASRRRWWPLGLVRHAAGSIAGEPKTFYGGIFIPGLREVKDVDPPDTVEEAEEVPVSGAPQGPAEGEAVTDPGSEFPDDTVDDIEDNDSGITDGTLLDPQYPDDDPGPDEQGSLDGDVDPA